MTNSFGFGINFGDFGIRFLPRTQRPFSTLHGDQIGFKQATRIANNLTRDAPFFQTFQTFQRRLGSAPSGERFDKVALLFTDFLAPNDGQDIVLLDGITGPNLPHFRRNGHLFIGIGFGNFLHADNFSRKPRMDDGQMAGIQKQGPGQHQRLCPGSLMGGGDLNIERFDDVHAEPQVSGLLTNFHARQMAAFRMGTVRFMFIKLPQPLGIRAAPIANRETGHDHDNYETKNFPSCHCQAHLC